MASGVKVGKLSSLTKKENMLESLSLVNLTHKYKTRLKRTFEIQTH